MNENRSTMALPGTKKYALEVDKSKGGFNKFTKDTSKHLKHLHKKVPDSKTQQPATKKLMGKL